VDALELELPYDASALAPFRREVREWLERREIAEEDVAAIVGACSEVVADAIESLPVLEAPTTIRLTVAQGEGDVVVRCAAAAGWRIEEHPSRHVAALLVGDVSVERTPGLTAVVLRRQTRSSLG
jgi:hypothetical protein